ncbi:Uncharacterised protein [Mycobacterium tuberculosis]|nr:Uncharacterised protein [Mycobacterium tuberculosis]
MSLNGAGALSQLNWYHHNGTFCACSTGKICLRSAMKKYWL